MGLTREAQEWGDIELLQAAFSPTVPTAQAVQSPCPDMQLHACMALRSMQGQAVVVVASQGHSCTLAHLVTAIGYASPLAPRYGKRSLREPCNYD